MFEAELIGKDRILDLALLKIDGTGFKALPFGDSTELKQGELVLAFGNPLGMDNSVSLGIVSAPARQLDEDDPRIFVQTDAPINPGNSGGPLVDTNGRVVGMNTFILSQSGGSEGIGFAIPSNVIRYAFTSFKKDGHVHRGQIGIFVRTITPPIATTFNLEPDNGVLVEDVIPGGPADKSGVEIGDVLLSLGTKQIRNVRDLYLELYQYAIGDTVRLDVLRDAKKLTMDVPVTENQSDPERFADLVSPQSGVISKLGILGLSIDSKVRQILNGLRYDEGVLVAALQGSSPYFGDQLQQGDVIHSLNGTPVRTVETLRSVLNQVKAGAPLVLQVERDGRLMLLVQEAD
jgi:serine protease Do